MKQLLNTLLIVLMITSCGTDKGVNQKVIYVSIAPLAHLVEEMAESSIRVEILVPETTSPETYEPTTAQIQRLTQAKVYIHTGLIDFERELRRSVEKLSDSLRIVDLSQGIETVAGSCSHHHDNHTGHSHGVDPHTWLSPTFMRGFALRIKETLDQTYPQYRAHHQMRFDTLVAQIDSLDRYIRCRELSNFAIAHPSLTYFARDYNLEQIAIEIEGKEPSIAQMKTLIERIKEEKITRIFYQRQTSDASAQTIARECNARVIEFDPLARNWVENLRKFTDQISQ